MNRINLFMLFWLGVTSAMPVRSQESCEAVYLQIHSRQLLAGDSIHAGVMVVDPCQSRFSELSNVVYVELWASESRPVYRTRILTKGGAGSVTIPLDPSLSSGYYLVRAYTRYMRNFSTSWFFRHWIEVLQPLKPPALRQAAGMIAPLSVTVDPAGPLLIDQPCNIFVTTRDQTGAFVPVNVRLVDESGDLIPLLSTDHPRSGIFEFVPNEGKQYRIEVETETEVWSDYPLPSPTDIGLRPQLRMTEDGPVVEIISGRSNSQPNLEVLLTVAGVERYREPLFLRPGATTRMALADVARQGISELSVLDADTGMPQAAITVYHKEAVEEVTEPIAALRAGKLHLIGENWGSGLFTMTYAESGLGGISLQSYLSEAHGVPDDLYLPTQAGDILQTSQWLPLQLEHTGSQSQERFQAEHGSIYLEGHIERNGEAVEEDVFFVVPGDPSWTRRSRSDQTGSFRLELEQIIGQPGQVILRTPNPAATISLASAFAPAPTIRMWPQLILDPDASDRLLTDFRYQQAHARFIQAEQGQIPNPSPLLLSPSYGQPDHVYRFQDYTRMPTEDALIEFVAQAYLKKKDGQKNILLLNERESRLFERPPLLMIDGIPVFKSASILSVSYRLVDRIEIVTKPFFLNGAVFGGVMNLITFQKDGAPVELHDGDIRADLMLIPGLLPVSAKLLDGLRIPDVSVPGSVTIFRNDSEQQTVEINGTDRTDNGEIRIQGFGPEGEVLEARIPVSPERP